MVKPWQAFALALVLLLAQQGSVQHALKDHAVARALDDAADRHTVAGEACGLCLAFAQVASLLAAGAVTPGSAAGVAFRPAIVAVVGALGAKRLATRSRGPPANA